MLEDVCKKCGREARAHIVNPNVKSEHAIICLACGIEAGVYCEKHDVPHQGFDDGSTACLECIDEEVQLKLGRRTGIGRLIERSLPPEEFAILKKAARGAGHIWRCGWREALLRLVVSKAQRIREEFVVAVSNLIEDGTAEFLLS